MLYNLGSKRNLSCKNSLLSLKRRRYRVSLWSPSLPLTLSHPCHPCGLQSSWIASVHHHSWMNVYAWCFRSLLDLTTVIWKLLFLECFVWFPVHPWNNSFLFFFSSSFYNSFTQAVGQSLLTIFRCPFRIILSNLLEIHALAVWIICCYLRLCVTVISTISFPLCDFLLEFENLM